MTRKQPLANLYLLYAWSQVSKATRGLSVEATPKCAINGFCSCIGAIIKGKVALSEAQKQAFQHYKKDLHLLAARKTPLKQKKKALKKQGLLKALTDTA